MDVVLKREESSPATFFCSSPSTRHHQPRSLKTSSFTPSIPTYPPPSAVQHLSSYTYTVQPSFLLSYRVIRVELGRAEADTILGRFVAQAAFI